jgi:hypothetical protein
MSATAGGRREARLAARRGVRLAAGLAVLVALGATAAGLSRLLTNGGPLALLDVGATRAPLPVAGRSGLSPGGAPVPVGFVVGARAGGPAISGPLTVTGLRPVGAGLPPSCPPAAWALDLPRPVRLAAGTTAPRVPATVTLTDDAPAGCQGVAVPAMIVTVSAVDPGGRPVHLNATADAPLSAAVLGTPGIALTDRSGRVEVVTTPDPATPAGARFTIEAADRTGRWTVACQLPTSTPCVTGRPAGEGGTRFRATALLGRFWRRTSVALRP